MSKGVAAIANRVEQSSSARAIYTFEVPKEIDGSVREVSLVELNANEELQAVKRARQDATQLGYEMAKASLIDVNGKPVSVADGSADAAWHNMPPKVRSLVIQAFAELHTPSDSAAEVFLKSRKVRV